MMQKKISVETVIIMNEVLNFIKKWEIIIDDDLIWPKQKLIIEKYRPFMSFDKVKYRKIMKNIFV
jgi:hypothetical protein